MKLCFLDNNDTTSKRFTDNSTQTDYSSLYTTDINSLTWENIEDLIDIFIDSLPVWSSVNNRIFSVLVYLILRMASVKFEDVKSILKQLNLLTAYQCHKWFKTIFEEDDLCAILRDERGKYERQKFYDLYPELEMEAKAFALENATKKKSTFIVNDLAKFVDKRFKELYGEQLYLEDNEYVRSVESCRVDLLTWGARWDSSKNRPYFEGHERKDVVEKRIEFINYFITNKQLYYYVEIDEKGYHRYQTPFISNQKRPRMLISHDESTYRIELPPKRWMYPHLATLFNKGRGRSIMVSAFLAQHQSTDLFELTDEEMLEAKKAYPDLKNEDKILNFYENSANSWIHPGKDVYFDNKTILRQFERLFQMLKFKKDFQNHDIEVIVDHATTHTTKTYDLNCMGMSPGTKCPYDTIEWIENSKTKSINCNDSNGESKGLLNIAKELGIIDVNITSRDIYINDLREKMAKHIAFDNTSNLEKLAFKYDVKIIWCPKYHCEVNPIEGFWCYSKNYVRKYNEQKFTELNNLIIQSKERFELSFMGPRLWHRFWRCLEMYHGGSSYREVLQTLFGAKSSDKIIKHKKNTNFNSMLK